MSHWLCATQSSPHVSRCNEPPASLLATVGEDISLAVENDTGWVPTVSRAGAIGDEMDLHVTDWAFPTSRGVTGGDVKELILTGWELTISRLRVVGDDLTVTRCVLASSRAGAVGDDVGANVTAWALARSRVGAVGDDAGLNVTGCALARSRVGAAGDNAGFNVTGWTLERSRAGVVGDDVGLNVRGWVLASSRERRVGDASEGTDLICWTTGWKAGTVGEAARIVLAVAGTTRDAACPDVTPRRGEWGADRDPVVLAGISFMGGLDVEMGGLPSSADFMGEGDGGLRGVMDGLPHSDCSVSVTIS